LGSRVVADGDRQCHGVKEWMHHGNVLVILTRGIHSRVKSTLEIFHGQWDDALTTITLHDVSQGGLGWVPHNWLAGHKSHFAGGEAHVGIASPV
jgi:hypothetical protein